MPEIARIEVHPLVYPEPHAFDLPRSVAIVRIEDTDGAVGWGECVCGAPEAAVAVCAVVDGGYAPLLVGTDPSPIRSHQQRMRDRGFWYGGGGIASLALSGVDIALWDLAGRRTGVPVHQLLGGKLHARFRASAAVMWDARDLGRAAEQSADYAAKGFTATKGGWGHPDAGFGLDADRDVEIVRRVREAVGASIDVAVDVSGRATGRSLARSEWRGGCPILERHPGQDAYGRRIGSDGRPTTTCRRRSLSHDRVGTLEHGDENASDGNSLIVDSSHKCIIIRIVDHPARRWPTSSAKGGGQRDPPTSRCFRLSRSTTKPVGARPGLGPGADEL